MANPSINSQLRPSLDEIISVALLFPIHDPRRYELWCLIIKDKDLTEQIVDTVNRNNATSMSIPSL